jgi:hypothetical protein
MIGYNEAEYTPETAPKSWQDLYTNEAPGSTVTLKK